MLITIELSNLPNFVYAWKILADLTKTTWMPEDIGDMSKRKMTLNLAFYTIN